MMIENEALERIAEELTSLRRESESADMRKAELFKQVQTDNLYKDGFGTFQAFCSHVGYHRSHVYTLIAVYDYGLLRDNYTEIGAMSAKAIVQVAKVLDYDQVSDLVELAKTCSSALVLRKCQEAKRQALDISDEVLDISERIRGLLKRKDKLLAQLQQVEAELTELRSVKDTV